MVAIQKKEFGTESASFTLHPLQNTEFCNNLQGCKPVVHVASAVRLRLYPPREIRHHSFGIRKVMGKKALELFWRRRNE